MARRKGKRSVPTITKVVVNNDQAESYEGDDEGRDEESPTPRVPTPEPVVPLTPKSNRTPGRASPIVTPKTKQKKDDKEESTSKTKQKKEDKEESTSKTNQKKEDKEESTPKSKQKKEDKEDSTSKTKQKKDDKEESTPKSKKKEDKEESTPKSKKKEDKEESTSKSKQTDDEEESTEKKTEEPENEKKKGKAKSDTKQYEVEEIVGMEVNNRWRCPIKFRLRWVGYGEKDDTWAPDYNLHCDALVEDFLQISGRKSEYEKALNKKNHVSDNPSFDGYKESLRKVTAVIYVDSDSDDEVVMTSSTRTRKANPTAVYDSSTAPRHKAAKLVQHGVSRAMARAQQAGREYEVISVVDHCVHGRLTDYKVRWKGLPSSHDSWVPEANLTCPKLVASYHKLRSKQPKPIHEVAAIIDSRDSDDEISYKVRWKGYAAKFDSWLPKDEMNCPEMIQKFEATLEKLKKKEDWIVSKIRARREKHEQVQFLVHWKDFDVKFDSWEPETNLRGCQDKLDEFVANEKKEKKKQKKRKSSGGGSDDSDDEEAPASSKRPKKTKRSTATTSSAEGTPSSSRNRRQSASVSYSERDTDE